MPSDSNQNIHLSENSNDGRIEFYTSAVLLLTGKNRGMCRKEIDSPWSWLVCFCAVVMIAIMFGISLNFGILFPVLMDYFEESRERTAWVGSVGIAFIFVLGPLTSMLVNRLGCRLTAMLGGLSGSIGLVLSSFASSIYVLYGTYSVLFGFGSSCIFVSSYAVTSQYFERNRSLATGILASGTGLGVLGIAPVLQGLLDSFDWRKTYRLTAAIYSAVCILGLTFSPALAKKEKNAAEKESERLEDLDEEEGRRIEICNKWIDFSVFKDKVFVVLTLSMSVAFIGHHAPRLHLVRFSEGLHVSADAASRLFIYIGITTFLGRLLSGILCNIRAINPLHVFMLGFILDGSSVILLIQAKNYGHLMAFSFLYGLADGFEIGTFNICMLGNYTEPRKRASAFGLSAIFYGTMTAAGPPLAGFMADHLHTYVPSFILAAVVELTAAALTLILVCDKKEMNHKLSERTEIEEDNRSEHLRPVLWETTL